MTTMTSKERVKAFFKREPMDQAPVFSGMGTVTVHGQQIPGSQRQYVGVNQGEKLVFSGRFTCFVLETHVLG